MHMKRRDFLGRSLTTGFIALPATAAVAAAARLPARARVQVAFLLGDDTNVIDTAGPWEVFQDVMVMRDGAHMNPFESFTVGASAEPLMMTGGMKVTPRYVFSNAPKPDVVVVPAQRASAGALDWLRACSKHADLIMSVCTGAYQLARAGLLDDLPATTHHEFWDDFAKEFPKVRLQRGPRFVDNGHIATSGGLTAGIDLALHVVNRYFDFATAAAAARFLEHASEAWH
jgi:transcriptional regulator GlxA family with amidase domain